MRRYRSWGGVPAVDQRAERLAWRHESLPMARLGDAPFLPFGNGRSYGDVCLNGRGLLLDCRGLDRFIAFDPESGLLRCESGVLLADIIRICLPRGWFPPVTPGTRFVTVGGAIANDVHGKNHHRAGTFGAHLRRFELLRSDGTRRVCSPDLEPELFAATIGGLGLTGVITWAEIQLKPVAGPWIDQEVIRFGDLTEFFTLARASDLTHEFTVAWVDCLATGRQLGRGLFIRGNHAQSAGPPMSGDRSDPRFSVPATPPLSLVNRFSTRVFNRLYYHRPGVVGRRRVDFAPFFYPLDGLGAWNRIYGRSGFFQYQCALPMAQAPAATAELLREVAAAGSASFLSVLKVFGDRPSPGLLSFPLPGVTLAMDFPNRDASVLRLLDRLDAVTRTAGGRVNPSKDARMSAADFQRGFPGWRRLAALRDPGIESAFWRRVTEG